MSDLSPIKADLSKVTTAQLHQELIKREGITATFVGPQDSLTLKVRGAAWVIVNRD